MPAIIQDQDLMDIQDHVTTKFGEASSMACTKHCVIFHYSSTIITAYKSINMLVVPYRPNNFFSYSISHHEDFTLIQMAPKGCLFTFNTPGYLSDVLDMVNSTDMAQWCFSLMYGYHHGFRWNVPTARFITVEDRISSISAFYFNEAYPCQPMNHRQMMTAMYRDVHRMFEDFHYQIMSRHEATFALFYLFPVDQLVSQRLGLHSDFTRTIMEALLHPIEETFIFDMNSLALDVFIQNSHLILNKDRCFGRKVLSFLVMASRMNDHYSTMFIEYFKYKYSSEIKNTIDRPMVIVENRSKFFQVEKTASDKDDSKDEDTDDENQEDPISRHYCGYVLQGKRVAPDQPVQLPFWHYVKVHVRYDRSIHISEASEEAMDTYIFS